MKNLKPQDKNPFSYCIHSDFTVFLLSSISSFLSSVLLLYSLPSVFLYFCIFCIHSDF